MLISRFVVAVLVVLGAGGVSGQDYPNRPIRIVCAPPGGGSDFVARQIAQGISGPLGQPLIVDNRPAAVQGEVLVKALPTGYTLLVTGGSFWIAPLLEKTSYDVIRDSLPISVIAREVNVVTVHPSVPVKSVEELIALAKAKPGALNYGSGVIGTSTHLAAALFNAMAGVNIVRVGYKGGALGTLAMVAGEVQLAFSSSSSITPHMKSGKVRALAVTSAQPSLLVPGLPPVAATVPGYESTDMTGIFAPAKTPGAIINRLSQEIVRWINLPDVKERFLNAGVEPVGTSPEQFAAILKTDIAKWSKVFKDAGIKVE